MRIGLHLLDIGAFKTQGGLLLHDVGALMRRDGTFEFFYRGTCLLYPNLLVL